MNKGENNEVILKVGADTTDFMSELLALENELDRVLNADASNKTFKELSKELENINDLTKMLKQSGLDGTKEFTGLTTKAKELEVYAKSISKEFGELSDNTFNNLSDQAAKAAVETEKFANGITLINHETTNSNQAMWKFHGLMEFGDKVMSVQGLGGAFSQVADIIGYSAQGMSEFASATGQAEKASERASKAQKAYEKAVAEGKDATELLAKAQEAQSIATDGATKATKVFKTALATIGIGLVVLALDMLITNWDKVKEALDKVLPSGFKMADMFSKVKEVIFGVGNAIGQYLLTPIKVAIDLINGRFKEALGTVAKGMNVVGNYQQGASGVRQDRANDLALEAQRKDIKALEDQLAIDQARGLNTRTKERKLQGMKLAVAEKEGEKEAISTIRQEQKIAEAKYAKEDEDKAKARAEKAAADGKARADKQRAEQEKALAEKVKKHEEALKIQEEADKQYFLSMLEEKDRELKVLEDDFNAKKALLDAENLNSQSLIENHNIAIQEINDKYAKIDEDKAKEKAEAERNRLLEIEAIKTAQKDLEVAKLEQQYSDERQFRLENELAIIEEISNAKIEAEIQAFEEEKARIGENKAQLELLEQEHQYRLTQIEKDASKDRLALKRREKAEQLAFFDAIGSGLDGVAGAMEENTLGAKAMSVASATISTLTAIVKTWEGYASMGPFGVAGAIAQSAAIATIGAMNIKKILDVKVNGKSGNANAPNLDAANFANATAPIVDAGLANGNNDVRVINSEDMVIRAFITDSDLEEAEKRKSHFNNLSGF